MQRVINISEDDYRKVQDGRASVSMMRKAIRNGTPLPKGHGRLIDTDSIHKIIKPIERTDTEWGITAETAIRLIHEAVNRAPTIIEAESEGEE